jgi:hypothetical protein
VAGDSEQMGRSRALVAVLDEADTSFGEAAGPIFRIAGENVGGENGVKRRDNEAHGE